LRGDAWGATLKGVYAVRTGDVLAGKYRVERVVGAGGMGLVVAARHLRLRERVAIKLLLPHAVSKAGAAERLVREARAVVRIASPHVARVLDVDVLPTGEPFIVMEYVEGTTLADMLERGGPLPYPVAALYVLQACRALEHAHALGVVHRDIKPANLMVTLDAEGAPCVKILDFGISKIAAEEMTLTSTTALLGSPAYMSPEHLLSAKTVDHRTDVWAIGVLLYKLVTGHKPFEADSLPLLCMRITTKEPARPRALDPSLPEGFEEIILRCLEKDRAARYQDMRSLALDLEPFAAVAREVSVVAPLPEPPSGSVEALGASARAPLGRRRRRRIVVSALAVAAGVGLGAIGLGTGARSREAPHLATYPPPHAPTEPPASPPTSAPSGDAIAVVEDDLSERPAADVDERTAQPSKANATTKKPARATRRAAPSPKSARPATSAATAPSGDALFRDRKW
jgi:eukaryotic-like serine/threonine-protein kinase